MITFSQKLKSLLLQPILSASLLLPLCCTSSANFFKEAYNLNSRDLVLVLNGTYQGEIEEAFIHDQVIFRNNSGPVYFKQGKIFPVINSELKPDGRSRIAFVNSNSYDKQNLLFNEIKDEKNIKTILVIDDCYESLFLPMKPFNTIGSLLGEKMLETKSRLTFCFFDIENKFRSVKDVLQKRRKLLNKGIQKDDGGCKQALQLYDRFWPKERAHSWARTLLLNQKDLETSGQVRNSLIPFIPDYQSIPTKIIDPAGTNGRGRACLRGILRQQFQYNRSLYGKY